MSPETESVDHWLLDCSERDESPTPLPFRSIPYLINVAWLRFVAIAGSCISLVEIPDACRKWLPVASPQTASRSKRLTRSLQVKIEEQSEEI